MGMSIQEEMMLGLAPRDLSVRRAERYDGGGFGISLAMLSPEDARIAGEIYRRVATLHTMRLYVADRDMTPLFREWIPRLLEESLGDACRRMGHSGAGTLSQPVARTLHDIRGGALMALLGYAEMIASREASDARFVTSALRLARDHAKMMRNALVDIDPPIRAADESVNIHPIDELIGKWNGLEYHAGARSVRVEARSAFHGNITSRCLETSAVDRILYNLVNNSARFASGDLISIDCLEVSPGLLRWVICNRIDPDQSRWIESQVGSDLGRLFTGGITREGHGIGLNNCAEFVAASFGLGSSQEAIEQGYLGAKSIDDAFIAWFHWPTFRPSGTSLETCPCAH